MGNTTTTHGTPDKVKIEPFPRDLRVALTDEEINERAKRQAHLLRQRDQKDEERKAVQKQLGAQIAEYEAQMRRVSGEINDGATYKQVSCERRHDYRRGQVTEVRLDTQEVIAERAMTDRERQLDLGLLKPNGNGKPKEAKAEASGGEVVDMFDDSGESEDEPEPAEADSGDYYDQTEEPPLATQKPKKKRGGRPRKKSN